jgi:hypothetical protein
MKEFMFYIRNEKNVKNSLTVEQHFAFIKKSKIYIGALKSESKLIAAQSLIREGVVISKKNGNWAEKNTEAQVGYYHILANDLDEAIRIAKENPEFEYVPSASIEVRPVKTKESETGFVYPKS